jgi:predicted dehydrogenase
MADEGKPVLRWGIVGTGSIANSMAAVIDRVPSATLAAVSSRRMVSAREFADRHNVGLAFDDWAAMFGADEVDAVYVATPTGVREEVSVAAANAGKHVLAEKPFASAASVERIAMACRNNDVGFMDGNHFGHHPRTAQVRSRQSEVIGTPWSLVTTFQFPSLDKSNIRYNPALEHMGAVGDVGWYCMRAVAEYLSPDLEIDGLATYLRRDEETGAAITGSGVIQFSDGTTSTWNCSYDTQAVFTTLRLTGRQGVITMDDFAANNSDGSADYLVWQGDWGTTRAERVRVASEWTSRELMFEDFAAMIGDESLRERSISDTLRTQRLVDQIWQSGIDNEA